MIYNVPQGGIINGALVVCGYHKCYTYKNDAWSQIGGDHNPSTRLASTGVIKGNAYFYIFTYRAPL